MTGPEAVGPLEAFVLGNAEGLHILKPRHFLQAYALHFERFRNRPITVVEFGVFQGGSLQMWREYFGSEARLVGVDIDPRCAGLDVDAEIVIGDQADPELHQRLIRDLDTIDIVIDDGGHHMDQQLVTFRELWPALRIGGLYVAEDVCTSYFPDHGGGLRRPTTFVERAKGLIDSMNAWFALEPHFHDDEHTRTLAAMHIYPSLMVFEKQMVDRPEVLAVGRSTLDF